MLLRPIFTLNQRVWFCYGRRGHRPPELPEGSPSPPQELEGGGRVPQTSSNGNININILEQCYTHSHFFYFW